MAGETKFIFNTLWVKWACLQGGARIYTTKLEPWYTSGDCATGTSVHQWRWYYRNLDTSAFWNGTTGNLIHQRRRYYGNLDTPVETILPEPRYTNTCSQRRKSVACIGWAFDFVCGWTSLGVFWVRCTSYGLKVKRRSHLKARLCGWKRLVSRIVLHTSITFLYHTPSKLGQPIAGV